MKYVDFMKSQRDEHICKYMCKYKAEKTDEGVYDCMLAREANVALAEDIRKRLSANCSESDRLECPLWVDREPPREE